MENLFNVNGLVFWDQEEIRMRRVCERHFFHAIHNNLKLQNRGFEFFQCEASLLTPRNLINPNYTDDDVFIQAINPDEITTAFHGWLEDPIAIAKDSEHFDGLHEEIKRLSTTLSSGDSDASDYITVRNMFTKLKYHGKELVLRPETTMGSYAYAQHILNPHHERKVKPPIVVWQHGKSFRREQDQVVKNMRLKEFYQLEFQIIYSASTKNDYSTTLIPAVRDAIASLIGPCRVEDSDRIPDYAEWTKDIICNKTNMEVCSISKRIDFEGMLVLEVAIGTDRCVHNFMIKDNIREEAVDNGQIVINKGQVLRQVNIDNNTGNIQL